MNIPKWVVVGVTFLNYDEDDSYWMESKILSIDPNKEEVQCEDIDERSEWLGLKYELDFADFNDCKQVKEKETK